MDLNEEVSRIAQEHTAVVVVSTIISDDTPGAAETTCGEIGYTTEQACLLQTAQELRATVVGALTAARPLFRWSGENAEGGCEDVLFPYPHLGVSLCEGWKRKKVTGNRLRESSWYSLPRSWGSGTHRDAWCSYHSEPGTVTLLSISGKQGRFHYCVELETSAIDAAKRKHPSAGNM